MLWIQFYIGQEWVSSTGALVFQLHVMDSRFSLRLSRRARLWRLSTPCYGFQTLKAWELAQTLPPLSTPCYGFEVTNPLELPLYLLFQLHVMDSRQGGRWGCQLVTTFNSMLWIRSELYKLPGWVEVNFQLHVMDSELTKDLVIPPRKMHFQLHVMDSLALQVNL